MHLVEFFLIFGIPVLTYAAHNPPKGLYFVGVGYNLLKGNPEGGASSIGGIDPGLLSTRKIFQLTWKTNKLSSDKMYNVPDQVSFAPFHSCVEENSTNAVFGAKSYQEELKVEVGAEAGYTGGLWSFSFSLSSRYAQMKRETSKHHNVYYVETKVCNRGRVRFQWTLAVHKEYPVSEEFAAEVCHLPEKYDEQKYLQFIDDWGTHVVIEVELGEKRTSRYKSSWADLTSYAMENLGNSVSVGGGFGGYSASLSVNVETFKESMNQNTKFGSSKKVYKSGGPDMPSPIRIKLEPIYNALRVAFFKKHLQQHPNCNFNVQALSQLKNNIEKLFKAYPQLKGAEKGQDPKVSIPFLWPRGTYGLPKPKSGCPKEEKGSGFVWHEGYRYHDTPTFFPVNEWSNPYDLAGFYGKENVRPYFCIKTQQGSSKFSLPWPKGEYCILKKGKCPSGFNEGWIFFDDADRKNANAYWGTLPDGEYGKDTKIFYCCRSDGFATNAIYLPTSSPFVLLQHGLQCQYVHGMNVRYEFFKWDLADKNTRYQSSGSIPRVKLTDPLVVLPALRMVKGKDLKLHYCYYYKKII